MLWRKGETSGHAQHVQGVYADCDADTLLVQVHQDGVACHTGSRTCFFTAMQGPGAAAGMLDRIEQIVAARKATPPSGSYVASLLAKGEAAVCRKIGEEAVEVVTAALGGEGDRRVVEEVADLWFHTMVLLGERSIPAARRARGAGPTARDAAGARSLSLVRGARCRRALAAALAVRGACAGRRIENGVYRARSGYRVTLPRRRLGRRA